MNKQEELEQMLIEDGLINPDQLEKARKERKQGKESLTRALVSMGLVDEDKMIKFLISRLDLKMVNLSKIVGIDSKVIETIPEEMAKAHLIFPVSERRNFLTLAMVDPLNTLVIEKVTAMGYQVQPVLACEEEIKNAIRKHYGEGGIVENILREDRSKDKEEESFELKIEGEESPTINLVNHFLIEAISAGASDIHIEPYEQDIWVRFRIDGVLHKISSVSRHLHRAIVSRIKIMSGINIAEQRLPQDGRARVKIENQEIDLRVSMTPTIFGENVVMRILDTRGLCLDLERLFEPEILSVYGEYIRKSQGFILISGPTGSGKTTTLYSTLTAIRSVEKSIMTVEDPVEYVLTGINQQQVRPEIGLDFSLGLRSFLRQDPDIIMVGEIRDRETAEVAVTAALTGHLVFSTIHTTRSSEIITRLLNMGVEPFLITSTLIMGVAQRLARTICPRCKDSYHASPEIADNLGIEEGTLLYRGKGCKYCNQIGYRGRTGIYEVMTINHTIQDMIINREPGHIIEEAARENGMITLKEAAVKKVLAGTTTVEELYRVTS
ncbi:MAG: Flp pilus assembly complex ATPase component TadA [Nitrospirae bacterium]|nr:Flp pilus assembly complex ATPase component TadA [Nitrospirota bacterium]